MNKYILYTSLEATENTAWYAWHSDCYLKSAVLFLCSCSKFKNRLICKVFAQLNAIYSYTWISRQKLLLCTKYTPYDIEITHGVTQRTTHNTDVLLLFAPAYICFYLNFKDSEQTAVPCKYSNNSNGRWFWM